MHRQARLGREALQPVLLEGVLLLEYRKVLLHALGKVLQLAR